jgi:hypothetical protein
MVWRGFASQTALVADVANSMLDEIKVRSIHNNRTIEVPAHRVADFRGGKSRDERCGAKYRRTPTMRLPGDKDGAMAQRIPGDRAASGHAVLLAALLSGLVAVMLSRFLRNRSRGNSRPMPPATRPHQVCYDAGHAASTRRDLARYA